MGRIIKHELIGVRCELRSCTTPPKPIDPPQPAGSTWIDHARALTDFVREGWSFVITPQLRAYCPQHADRVWDCTCRTNPTRAHLCTAHNRETAGLVWDQLNIPAQAVALMEVER